MVALRLCILFIAIAATLAPAISLASQLTLDDALQSTISNNPDLKAARADVEAARGRLLQAGLWPNPRLELTNETDKPFRDEGDYARSGGLSLDVPIAGRIGRQKDVARVDVALAVAELNNAERKVLGDVSSTYYSIASADRQINLLARFIARVDVFVSAVEARRRVGEVSSLDANTALLERQRLQQQRIVLETERAAKLSELAAMLGLSSSDALLIDTMLPAPHQPAPLATLMESALAHRPDLFEARLTVDRAGADHALARASAWEDWSVMFGVQESRTVLEQVPIQPRDKALMLSLSVPLPLFNRNQGTLAAARASEFSASDRLTAVELRIRSEVTARYLQISRLAQSVQALIDQALPLSASNLDQSRTAYQRGQIGIADFVQIERQAFDISMGYEQALSGYYQALAALDLATFSRVNLATHLETK